MLESPHNQESEAVSPELRAAMIELGYAVPTTPAEVALAEAQLSSTLSKSEIDAAFSRLVDLMEGKQPRRPIAKLKPKPAASTTSAFPLSMAARNGAEFDDATRQKIDDAVARALNNRTRP